MRFITCRGCKLPFHSKVRSCPYCGELFPSLSKKRVATIKQALVLPWLIGGVAGLPIGWGVAVHLSSLAEDTLVPLALGAALVGGVLGQLYVAASERPAKDKVPLGLFFAFSCTPLVTSVPAHKALTVIWWAGTMALLLGLPGVFWWERLKREARTCWMETRQRAAKRHSDITDQLRDIQQTRERVTQELSTQGLAERLAILDQGRQDLLALRARYTACRWQTDLLRWHARLKHHLDGPAPENRAGCEAAVADLDALAAEGVYILERWKAAADMAYPEPKDCVTRLKQLLGVCSRLRQSILDHQIILVTRDPRAGALPDDTSFHKLRSDLRALEAGIIQSEFQDPWNTAARIEEEAARLVARTEIEQGVLSPTNAEEWDGQRLNRTA